MEDGRGPKCHFSIAPRIKSDRREATTLVVRCGTCKTDKHRMKEKGSSHCSDSFFCGHFNCSKSMFLCLLSLPETWCIKEKPHTTPSSPTNTSHMNIIAMGTNKGSPFCSPVYGQLRQNLSCQIQHLKPIIGFAEFLLGEVCFLQDYDSEIHWRRPRSTASNEHYRYFCFLQMSAGGTKMGCAWAHGASTQVHWYPGNLSLLHHFVHPRLWIPIDCCLTNTALTSRKWIHMGFP